LNGILKLLSARLITYLTIGNGRDALDDYDAVLEIANDANWSWKSGPSEKWDRAVPSATAADALM
jgi:hypothetical protein